MQGTQFVECLIQSQYWIARHIHLCVTPASIVVLDLRRDKYLALNARLSDALALLVCGWPQHAPWSADTSSTPLSLGEALELAERQVQTGLLTRDPALGRSAAPIALESIEMADRSSDGPPIRIRLSHAIHFTRACWHARWMLSARGLEGTVRYVQDRKHRAGSSSTHHEIVNPDRERQLATIFRWLYAWTFTARDRCLFDALSLINFLAYYRHYPNWVLGVRTDPFLAHSWVQQGREVLGSLPEQVCEYTPILAV